MIKLAVSVQFGTQFGAVVTDTMSCFPLSLIKHSEHVRKRLKSWRSNMFFKVRTAQQEAADKEEI